MFDPRKNDYANGDLFRATLNESVTTGEPQSKTFTYEADTPQTLSFEVTDASLFHGTGSPFSAVEALGARCINPAKLATRFLLESGLYSPIDSVEFFASYASICTIDTFCLCCGAMGVFKQKHRRHFRVGTSNGSVEMDGHNPLVSSSGMYGTSSASSVPSFFDHSKIIELNFICARSDDHRLSFIIEVNGETAQKVGQLPSIADLAIPKLKKYQKLLGRERHQELTKGVGLFAHGVGIGSFVYLRRIVESLVAEAAIKAVEGGEPAKGLTEMPIDRMLDRIKRLRDYLPQFLVDNAKLYGTLSDGIHNLTEEKCLTAFPAVRLAIEMILDEKLVHLDREAKARKASRMLSDLAVKPSKD